MSDGIRETPAPAWEPIETAPKDGTRVLTFSTSEHIQCAFWSSHDTPSWDAWNSPDGYTLFDVTHWMPLPEPPASSGRNLADATP